MSALEQAMEIEASELERRLEQSADFRRLRVLRQALTDLRAIGGAPPIPMVASAAGDGPLPGTRKVATSIWQAVSFSLEAAGKPLPTRQLLEDVKLYGRSVGGQNPVWGLSNTLSTDPRFVSVPWAGAKAWWFVNREVPEET